MCHPKQMHRLVNTYQRDTTAARNLISSNLSTLISYVQKDLFHANLLPLKSLDPLGNSFKHQITWLYNLAVF
jgi:hypothetical protein